jgi:hypothetical protein
MASGVRWQAAGCLTARDLLLDGSIILMSWATDGPASHNSLAAEPVEWQHQVVKDVCDRPQH